ncbi:MAG: DUF899 family protein [Gemmatimonadota bacterium]|nr:DUF899 family protein [Gemmatimonadota bacterium]
MTASRHQVRFPGESTSYREARDKLLEAEIEIRRAIESVTVQRRALPLGGAVPTNYEFDEVVGANGQEEIRRVEISELFAKGIDSLILYSFMYGPEMARPCPLCTSIIDALDAEAPHVVQRVNLGVVAKSPIKRIREFAGERGWHNVRLLSSERTTYNHDYQGENVRGEQMPALNVFVRKGDQVFHTYCTELLFAPPEPGQDGRHVDSIWPLWNLFDFTPEGRGENWRPKLSY